MSDIRFNRWLHQSGTGGVYQDSSGRVGIGTSVPTTALDVQSGTIKIGSNTLSSTGVSTFTTVNANSVSATSIVGVATAGIMTAYITTLSGISTIDASAAVSINQNLVFPSGKGIDFSATANSSGTMTSELLSDYEEGTWTPSAYLSFNPSGGKSVSSSSSVGRYIRVGSVVTVWFSFAYTLSGTGSYNMGVTGLPFTADSAISMVGGGARETSSTGAWFQCESINNTQIAVLRRYDNGGPPDPSGTMSGFATYRVA